MSRLFELTETFLCRELSNTEMKEIHQLLEEKAEGFQESMELMETEGLLRGMLADVNPQKAVMERIFSLDDEETAQAVMTSIRQKKQIRKPNLKEVRRREKISPYPIIFSIAAIIVLGLFIYTGLKKTPQNTIAVIDSLEGTGQLHRKDKVFDLKSGLMIMSGDEIVSDDKVTISLNDSSSVILEASSEFQIVKADENWKLSLKKGSVSASVKPQKGTFRVKTPAMEVTVVGTEFAVSHREGESQVKVSKGKVKSTAAGKSFDITAGQEFKAVKNRIVYKPRKIATVTKVISFDLEGGVLPSGLQHAAIKASKFFPPGNNSKFVVQGLPSREKGKEYRVNGIQQIIKAGIFTYRKETVIKFDYWISPKCFWLGIWMRCEKRNINVYDAIKPVFNKWASAEVPLSTLVSKATGEKLQPGDVINRWHLMTNSSKDAEIYLDNIRIEYR